MYCISAFTGGSSWVGPAALMHALLTRSLAPALERRLGPPCGCMVSSNYDGTEPLDTFPPQGPPKPLVRRAPGAQFGVGIFARIDVGESGGFGSDRDGEFQGKVAGLFPHGSLIDPVGNPAAVDAQGFKETDLFRLGGKPGIAPGIPERSRARAAAGA